MNTIFGKIWPKDILMLVFLIALSICGYFNLKTNQRIIESDRRRIELAKKTLDESAKNVVIMNSMLKTDSGAVLKIIKDHKDIDSLIKENSLQNRVIIHTQAVMLKALKELTK